MKTEQIEIACKTVSPFTIPSGIIMTDPLVAKRVLEMVPQIGIWTTKSIGPRPRDGNREPIFAQYSPGSFVNAVGLTNPGAEEFAKQLADARIPGERFILASIFGGNVDEFVYVARTLEDHVDGFELNLSCPHAEGHGMALGQDPNIVKEITWAVVNSSRKGRPVFAKLTPNTSNIGEIARAAIEGGAYGITAINTVGPGYHLVNGEPVLTNRVGGISGKGILPVGLKCISDIRQAVGEEVPIVGMGGINDARDVENYSHAGANVFGIGSALIGMTDQDLQGYFKFIVDDLKNPDREGNASVFLKQPNMEYRRVMVGGVERLADDFNVIRMNENLFPVEPGQFVFAWIPGVGEKPFSVMDDDPLTLGVLERGCFTKAINSLERGGELYVRGPYGSPLEVNPHANVVLVGGGSGIAGLTLLAKRFPQNSNVTSLLGAKNLEHIPYLSWFERAGDILIATEDGSLGRKGVVTDLFASAGIEGDSYFFNCGPKAMVDAVLHLEREYSGDQRILSSVDHTTKCGVGICGSCGDDVGRRSCVEGPFMSRSV